MIRILHVVSSMNRGGLETFLMNLYRNIDRTQVQFDFLKHTDNECAYDKEIKSLGGRIYSVTSRSKGILKNRKSLKNFFLRHPEYKIVHQHVSSLSYMAPLKLAKENNVPYRIVHCHNTSYSGSKIHGILHKINQRLLHKYATNYFACSKLAAKWLLPKKMYREKKYSIVKNAISTKEFYFNEDVRKEYRKSLNVKDNFVIGHIGRFHHQKNHGFLIDIFYEFQKNNKESSLLLIGEGEVKDEIEAKVKEYGISEKVIFTGVRSDVPELFQAMDAFVFPSLYEGFGIVLVEAQASGLKCYTSSKVVPEEVNVTGEVNYISITDPAKTWSKAIKGKTNEARHLTKNAVNEFDIQQVAEEVQKWYMETHKQI
ncbi:glycosyltransferase family 1 protein [Halobacillus litoralis]|uniref:glycosyltransferase family 1 protein n=1 Tax=Halobacillus litoralis TaxID=45668 RepID=UPI001CFDB4E4|nr:glycosyltransferase family 1 protein [Halobacillus litoralis]WLR49052.1 glycosyltransferase family 1 protein [Halobacillus litoralis]